MTVIASFSIEKYPVLLGDLLISGFEDLDTTLNLPTIGEITRVFTKGSIRVPIRLRQKTAILNENLAITWSGIESSAQKIINSLYQKAKNQEYWNLEDLSTFFKDFDNTLGKDVGIIGLSNDGSGIFSFGYGETNKLPSVKYGLIRSSGSGAKDLILCLNDFDKPIISKKINPLETAIGTTLAVTTYLMGNESVNGQNLIQLYGGGYEIVSFVNKKFKKIDDITYLIWFGKQNSDSSWGLSLPKTIIKYFYQNDILIIRKIEVVHENNKPPKCENEAIYSISPIYRQINNSELKNLNLQSFNSRFICSFIVLERFDRSIQILNRINFSSQNTNPIKFNDDDKDIFTMDIRQDFIESIFKFVNSGTN